MSNWEPADLQSWSMTEASIKEDGAVGAKFLVFLNFWLSTAEKMMADGGVAANPGGCPVHHPTPNPDNLLPCSCEMVPVTVSPANAVRKAMEVAEQRLGFIDVHYMAQLLVVIAAYWKWGDDFAKGMSAIELKVCGEGLRIKLEDLAEGAEDDEDGRLVDEDGNDRDSQAKESARQDTIDPLDESDRSQPDADRFAGLGPIGALAHADPVAHGEAFARAQARRREARRDADDSARDAEDQ